MPSAGSPRPLAPATTSWQAYRRCEAQLANASAAWRAVQRIRMWQAEHRRRRMSRPITQAELDRPREYTEYTEDRLRFAKLDQERLDAAKEQLRRFMVKQARTR